MIFFTCGSKGAISGPEGSQFPNRKKGKRQADRKKGGWGELGVKSTVFQKPAGSDLVGYRDKGFKLIWEAVMDCEF